MKKMIQLTLVLCFGTGIAGMEIKACSVFTASHIDKVLAATNKDWNNTCTRIKFHAPEEGKYGRVYFGYQLPEGFQNVGGMNEYGLWYDGASLPARSDVVNHFHKPTVHGELCEKALEECRTVAEVILLYKKYYTPHWQGHSMWADRMGNSVIIEYGEKDVVFLHKEHGFQVMTNFYLSDTANLRWSRCHRFNAITEILGKAKDLDVALMTRALEASHKEGLTPTLFSNVYDLKKGEIYVYHFHYYGEFVHIKLSEELEKGDQYLDLPQLFSGIRLKSPASEQQLSGQEICFAWSGRASAYELRYSPNREFQEYQSVRVNPPYASQKEMQGCFPVGILVLGFCLMGRYKKLLPMTLAGLILLGGCSGCSKLFISPEFPDAMDYSVQVKNLESGKTYFWKVLAVGEELHSESRIYSFTTTNQLR